MPSLSISEQRYNFQFITALTAEFGNPPNYSEFEDDGTLVFNGDATTWCDFNFGVNALARGGSAPDLITVGSTAIEVLGFDGINTTEEVSVVLEMDHMWKEGSTIYPHVHWLPTTDDAGDVKWQLEYVVVQDNDVMGASTTISILQAAGGVAWTQKRANFPSVNLAGFLIGAQFYARFFRDPTDGDDDYGADAAVATFGLHIEQDTTGSRRVTLK